MNVRRFPLAVGLSILAGALSLSGAFADAVPQTITVPLQLVNISSGSGNPSYKLGINIGFDNGVPKLYEFDTGAAGFFAAYLQNYTPWWGGGTALNPQQQITMEYTSGYEYNAAPIVSTNLSFYPPGATTATNPLVTASGVNVAQIDTVLYQGNTDAAWDAALKASPQTPPLETQFYGDFGMALYNNQGFNATNSPTDGLFAIIPQLPGNLSSGFIVRTGGYGNPTPQLQIGITDTDRAAYPYAIPLQTAGRGAGTGIVFPSSSQPTFPVASINANVSLLGTGGATQSILNTPIVLDSGATSTEVHEGAGVQIESGFLDNSGGTLAKGTSFTLSDGSWSFQQQQEGVTGVSEIGVSSGSTNIYAPPGGFVNSGITLYFQYNVMFDLAQGMLRLQPIPAQGSPYVVPIYRTSASQDFTIYAAMGVGGTLVPYLLDTGSPQAFATYGSWWATPPPEQTVQGANTFTFAAGFGYYWTPWSSVVSLGTNAGQVIASTGSAVNIGLITNVEQTSGQLTPQQSYTQWQSNYNNGQTALSDGTFGNFGSALYGDGTFATIMAQMPLGAGLKRGFIINSDGASSLQGTVTIGLSAATIQSYSTTPGAIILPMADLKVDGVEQVLAGGANAYEATQVTSSYVNLNQGQYIAAVPTIFDTGGGDKVVFYQDQTGLNAVPSSLITGGGTNGPILPGTAFTLSGEDPSSQQAPFMSFQVENTTPVVNTLVLDGDLTAGIGGVRVNTGIQIFNQYQVMFDLDDGILGLLPITTPAPTPPQPIVPPTLQVTSRKRQGPDGQNIQIRGQASSSLGIAKVTYRNGGKGKKLTAKGTVSWRFVLTLKPGHNRIQIQAVDTQGNVTTSVVDIVRK